MEQQKDFQTMVKEFGNVYYNVTLINGEKLKTRLFYHSVYGICAYNRGSRRYGHQLIGIVDICPVTKHTKSDVEIVRTFMEKVVKRMEQSGLWVNTLCKDFKIMLAQSDEYLDKYLKANYDERHEIERDLGICFGLDSLLGSAKVGIKSINYYKWDKECEVANFDRAIKNKNDYHYSWRKGYDNRVECAFSENNNEMRGWYSEEYKNYGNGHYYLAIDSTHAIFCEND